MPKISLFLHNSAQNYIPYPLEYNHGVIFFKMGFWVRFNSKNPSKSGLFDQKMGFYSRKTPKTGLLKSIFKGWGYIQEWGSTRADTVSTSSWNDPLLLRVAWQRSTPTTSTTKRWLYFMGKCLRQQLLGFFSADLLPNNVEDGPRRENHQKLFLISQ